MRDGEWTTIEAVILASLVIASSSDQPDLAGIIGFADYLDRVILNREEIESAVSKFRSAGLVDPEDPLAPTVAAKSLWAQTEGDSGAITRVGRLADLMNRETPASPSVSTWSLDQATYDEAVTLYRRRFDEAQRKL